MGAHVAPQNGFIYKRKYSKNFSNRVFFQNFQNFNDFVGANPCDCHRFAYIAFRNIFRSILNKEVTMRSNLHKITLATAFGLFLTFTFGCASKKTVADINGDEEVVSIRNELQELCNREFIDKNFCGIGQGVSNSESMASQVATVQARENLAASVQTTMETRAKTFSVNDPNGNALEGAAMRAIANVSQEITDIRTQKIRTMFNKEEKKYTVYVLQTSSRAAALELAKQKLRASEELAQIQRTLNLNANVERILD